MGECYGKFKNKSEYKFIVISNYSNFYIII